MSQNRVQVRAAHRLQGNIMFSFVDFPKQSICVNFTAFARGLWSRDAKVEMRPATAAAFFAEYANALALFDVRASGDGFVDG